jgi:hypothetical protein
VLQRLTVLQRATPHASAAIIERMLSCACALGAEPDGAAVSERIAAHVIDECAAQPARVQRVATRRAAP